MKKKTKSKARARTGSKRPPAPKKQKSASPTRKKAKAAPGDARTPRVQARGGPAPQVIPVRRQLSEEEVRIRAYHRYVARGGEHGHDLEDWYAAERELDEHSA